MMRRANRFLQILVSLIAVSCFVGQSTPQSLANRPLTYFKAVTYEAEKAQVQGGKIAVTKHPNASAGAFVEAQSDAILHFSVNAPQPMIVRVVPVFWRNSLREQPRFFPYPPPTLFGPDVVVALGNRFYFTAPASGQVGIVDASNGQIVGSVKLGGYLTDLVADEKRQRLLVADAWNGRVIAVDAKTLRVVAEVKIPQVWSLTLTPDDKLVAISRSERKLLVIEAQTLKPLQKIALSAPPTQVSVTKVGASSAANITSIAVSFEPTVLRLPDLAKLPADRIDYGFGPRTTAEFGPRNQVGWKRFAVTPQGLQLIVRTEKGDEQRFVRCPKAVSLSLWQSLAIAYSLRPTKVCWSFWMCPAKRWRRLCKSLTDLLMSRSWRAKLTQLTQLKIVSCSLMWLRVRWSKSSPCPMNLLRWKVTSRGGGRRTMHRTLCFSSHAEGRKLLPLWKSPTTKSFVLCLCLLSQHLCEPSLRLIQVGGHSSQPIASPLS